jgi:hypothetical protein
MPGGNDRRFCPPKRFVKELEESADFASYGLRSEFFARKLRELSFFDAAAQARKLVNVKDSFRWDRAESFGIDPQAMEAVRNSGVEPVLFFVHPRVLAEQPRLLLYYRCLAMISQKGFQRLATGKVTRIESGALDSLDRELLGKIVFVLNRLLSLVAKSFTSVTHMENEHLLAFLYAQAGAQIQGSWNNAIGEQGETSVRQMLLHHLRECVVQVVWKDDTTVDVSAATWSEVLANTPKIKVVRMRDAFHLVFASEPDVSLRNPDDVPLVSVEVKAGTDPAGALERFGAAMKSFDHEIGLNPRLKTVYVASRLTDEVRRRLQRENPFSHTYLLSKLLSSDDEQRRFANLFVRQMSP